MEEKLKILLLEDSKPDAELIIRELKKVIFDFEYLVTKTEKEFTDALHTFKPDVILSDYALPQYDGMQALDKVKEIIPFTPFIIITGSINEETAVECIKNGAWDYVLKGSLKRLPNAVMRAINETEELKARKQSEEKYHLLVSSINEGLMQIDKDDRILFVNQKLCDMFGYTEDELLGKIGYEILIENEDQQFIKEKNQQRENIPYEHYEVKGRKKSGEMIWLEISSSAVKDDKGNVIGSVGLLTDITDRKQAEARIEHMNKILMGIRNVNQLIVTEDDPLRLIEQTCANLIKSMGYHNAWIALVGGDTAQELGLPETGPLAAAAVSGFESGFESLRERLDKGIFPECMKQALDSDNVIVVDHPATDCPDCPLHSGYVGRAGLARRLIFDGATYGILTVSVPETYARGTEEQDLFNEVAGDLSFALHKIATARQLEEARRRYTEIFEHSRDGFVMVDAAGRIFDANNAFCEMLGYSLEELRALPDFYRITPEHWHEWEATEIWEKRLLSRGFSGLYEKEYIRKDGTVFPVQLSFYVVRRNNGEIDYLWGTARDITERKRATEELRASEKRFKDIAHSSGDWIWEVDANGKYTFTSGRVEQILGYMPEELIGKTPFDFMPEEEAERVGKIFEEIASGKHNIVDLENWNLSKKGEHVCLLTNGVPLLDSNGVLTGYRGVDKDITERKLAEEKLRESEEKFRTLADNTSDVIAIMDLQGKITYMSRGIEAEMGYTKEEIEGTNIRKLLTPESYNLAMSRLQKRLKGEKINAPFEVGIFDKNGKVVPFELNTSTIIEKGELTGIQIVARNISERKKMQLKQETLLKISEALNRTFDLTDLCDKIRILLGKVMDTTNFSVALYDEKTDTISLPYDVDKKDRFETFPAGKTLAKYVIETAKPLLVGWEEIKKMSQEGKVEIIGTPSKVWMGVPLIVEKETIGIIALQSYDDPACYSQEDVGILTFVSEAIALAIKRAKSQEDLVKSRAKFREILEATTEGIWEWNIKEDVLEFSDRYYTMLDYKPKEFEPTMKKWAELLHPEDRASAEMNVDDFIQSGMESYFDEFRMKTKFGGYRWIRSKGKVIEWDEEDKPLRVIGSHEDITYEKVAEIEAKRYQKSFINIVESSIHGIIILDNTKKISYANPQALSIFESTERELEGTLYEDLIKVGDSGEVELHRKDGKKLYLDIKTTHVQWEGVDSQLVLLQDITSRIETEMKIRQSNIKLEQLSNELEQKVEEQVKELREKDHLLIKQSRQAAMGEMISNIAHQWRQPLTAVGAIVQDIEEAFKYGELNEEYLRESISNTMQQLEYMSHTIDDFRNFFMPSRLKEKFQINKTIGKTISFLESSFKNNSITIEADLKAECEIEGFSNEFTQVLLNILNNAKDAIKKTNPKEPFVKIILEKTTDEDFTSRVTIENNGGQIPEDIIDKIFDPYFTTKHQSEGTGLGLYMSKMLIENMKGRIDVQNIDDGVRFTIEV